MEVVANLRTDINAPSPRVERSCTFSRLRGCSRGPSEYLLLPQVELRVRRPADVELRVRRPAPAEVLRPTTSAGTNKDERKSECLTETDRDGFSMFEAP